jgi:hypothetical protein
MARSLKIEIVLTLTWISLLACQSPSTASKPAPPTQRESPADRPSPSRDLSLDEAAGGHVLRKHVGRTDEELRERLQREHHISGASTYTDRVTAEHAIGTALAQNQDRIQRWLNREGGHANLVLDYDSDQPIGRTLNRDENQPRTCSHAVVVLRYDPPTSYHVLTSYPECRP